MLKGPLNLYNRIIHYVVGGLVLLTIGLGLGWYVTDLKLDTCKQSRKTDKALYEAAAAKSLALHQEAIKKKEQEYVRRAEQADASYASLSARFNDTIRMYTEANRRATSGAITRAKGGVPSSLDGPSEATVVLGGTQTELDITEVTVLPVEDLVTCAENTARLIVARDWALGIKTEQNK